MKLNHAEIICQTENGWSGNFRGSFITHILYPCTFLKINQSRWRSCRWVWWIGGRPQLCEEEIGAWTDTNLAGQKESCTLCLRGHSMPLPPPSPQFVFFTFPFSSQFYIQLIVAQSQIGLTRITLSLPLLSTGCPVESEGIHPGHRHV